jgi:hypothetical protein
MVTSLFMRQRYPYLRHLVSWRRLSVICGVIHLCRSSLMGSILGSANAGHQKIQQQSISLSTSSLSTRNEIITRILSWMQTWILTSTAYSSVLPGRYPPHRLQPFWSEKDIPMIGRRTQQEQIQDRDDVDGTSTDVSNDGDPSYEGRLRSTLMKNYDRNCYPWEKIWSTTTTLLVNQKQVVEPAWM